MSTGFEQQSGSWLELLGVPVSWQVILLSERLWLRLSRNILPSEQEVSEFQLTPHFLLFLNRSPG